MDFETVKKKKKKKKRSVRSCKDAILELLDITACGIPRKINSKELNVSNLASMK